MAWTGLHLQQTQTPAIRKLRMGLGWTGKVSRDGLYAQSARHARAFCR